VYRALDGIYWVLWLLALGAALAGLASASLRIHVLALFLTGAAELCWLLLPLPYPGSIEREVIATAITPGVARLPQAFVAWDRIELVPAAGDAQLSELEARDGAQRIAEIELAPGKPAVSIGIAAFERRADSAQTSKVAVVDCNGASSPQVRIFAAGRWRIIAGEESRRWKDLRAGWSVAQGIRAWLCWAGAEAQRRCTGSLRSSPIHTPWADASGDGATR
jgi:hypothetical protein